MEKAGEGIANQRKAIALGIKDSLEIIQETGVGNDEPTSCSCLRSGPR